MSVIKCSEGPEVRSTERESPLNTYFVVGYVFTDGGEKTVQGYYERRKAMVIEKQEFDLARMHQVILSSVLSEEDIQRLG